MKLFSVNTVSQKAFGQEKRWLFYSLAILSAIGNFLDLFILEIDQSSPVFYINILNITLIMGGIILYYFKKLSVHTATATIIYTLIFNFIISQFYSTSWNYFEGHFFRLGMFTWMLMLFAGFIINRFHILIIGSLHALQLMLAVFSGNQFIVENLMTIMLAIGLYTFISYYIIYLIDQFYGRSRELMLSLSREKQHIKSVEKSLQAANKTKDRLFSVVSHDLKNNSNLILNFSSLLAQKNDYSDTEKIKKLSETLLTAAENNNALLMNLLEWSKTQSNSIEYCPSEFELTEILDVLKKEFSLQCEHKNIRLTISNTVKVPILADKIQLASILRNLTSNAIKFSPDTSEVKIDASIQRQQLVLKIIDPGIGMTPEQIRLTMRMQPIHSTTGTNNEKGSGLGISICHHFVEMHGGSLSFGSVEGQGTEVLIQIPMKEKGK